MEFGFRWSRYEGCFLKTQSVINPLLTAKPSVVLVSAFGRGNWLAAELVSLGLEVHLVDVTDGLGRWAPEDWEGPFGYFQTDEMLQTQRSRLDEEDYSEAIDDGFVLWLKSGPLDLRGSHSQYLLESREVPSEIQEYVANYDRLSEKRRSELKKQMRGRDFKEIWFAALAHAISCPVSSFNRDAINYGRPLPFFAPAFVRRVSRRGSEKSLAWAESRGVKVYQKAKLKDISISGKIVQGVEIESDWSGVINADRYVWALNSLEIQFLNSKIGSELFSDGPLKQEWVWLRYRIHLQTPEINETLPLKFVLIEDLALPWTHENLQLIQKTVTREACDVWVRGPEVMRFQKNYLEGLGQKIIEILSSRLPDAAPVIVDMPQDYLYGERQLGPSRFGVYSADKLHKLKKRNLANMYFDSSEQWEILDWNGQFQHQQKIFVSLKFWKQQRDRKLEKLKAREQSDANNELGGAP